MPIRYALEDGVIHRVFHACDAAFAWPAAGSAP